MLSKPSFAALIVTAGSGLACVTLPPWSATQATAPHYIYAYALALMLLWLPLLRLLRPSVPIHEPLVFAALAGGLLALSQAHHASMLLLAHALLFSIGTLALLGRYARFGAALQFFSALGIYVYAVSFLLRAFVFN